MLKSVDSLHDNELVFQVGHNIFTQGAEFVPLHYIARSVHYFVQK